MKHLANCTIDEFTAAAVKARPLFVEWVEKTGVRDPRETIIRNLPDDADRLRRILVNEAALGQVLAQAFEKAPDLTRQLLCLATFTAPEDFGAHTLTDYYQAATEMYNNDAVRSFFTWYVAPGLLTSTQP